MTDRPTPLTDAHRETVAGKQTALIEMTDFTRDLERKLAEAREALELITDKNSMLRSYTAEEAANDAKQALARIDEKGKETA